MARPLNYICKIISQKTGVLKRVRDYVKSDILEMVYNAKVLPNMDYGCVIWGTCPNQVNILWICKLQKDTYKSHTDVCNWLRSVLTNTCGTEHVLIQPIDSCKFTLDKIKYVGTILIVLSKTLYVIWTFNSQSAHMWLGTIAYEFMSSYVIDTYQ